MPLSDIAVRTAKSGGKSIKLFDERGLYLEVSPRGGKWWRLKYRYAGKENAFLSASIQMSASKPHAIGATKRANYWPKESTLANTARR